MLKLARIHASSDPKAFALAYKEALVKVANSLASPGFAPIASVATRKAVKARNEFIDMLDKKREAANAKS